MGSILKLCHKETHLHVFDTCVSRGLIMAVKYRGLFLSHFVEF